MIWEAFVGGGRDISSQANKAFPAQQTGPFIQRKAHLLANPYITGPYVNVLIRGVHAKSVGFTQKYKFPITV